MIKKKTLPMAIMLASSLTAPMVMAQSSGPTLEEVMVTAQKREQSLQDIPIAVTAFDQSAIEKQRIMNVTDISIYAPNVEIVETPGNSTASTIAIRGASQINPAITWENSVGIYLDGVFLGKNLGGIFNVTELERVEVLRGPQGTLYGKNTVGGAVNLITRKPSGEFGGKVRLEAGNYGHQAAFVSIDTPDVAGFKANIAVHGEQRDGFTDNEPDPFGNPFAGAPSNDEFNDNDSKSARLALLWDISEDLYAAYTYDYSDQDRKPRLGQLTQTSTNSYLSSGGLQDAYLTKDDELADEASNDFSFYEQSESQGHSLDLGWSGDKLAFKSITAYRELDYDDRIDIDGTPIDIFHSERHVDYDSFSQEFQLTGSTDQIDYVMGLYYFEEEGDVFNPITFFGAFGTPTLNNSYGLDNNSLAVYGQADWRPAALDDRLTLTLGVRWTEEEKDQYIVHPGDFSSKADDTWTNTSPTFTASWAFTDNVNAYFRVAEGWKSGGFNGEASSEATFQDDYDPEEVLSYEMGVKSQLADGRIQLNAAVFQNDIDDYQLSVFEGAAAASLVTNIPEFQTKGFELEMVALITEDLRMNLTYGYLDAEYKKFPSDFTLFDEDDAGIPYAPENSFSLGLDWAIAQTDYGLWDLHVDYSFSDEYTPYIDPDQVAVSDIDSRSLVNARFALSEVPMGQSGLLQVALWVNNLTDEEYRINTIPFGGVDQRVDPNGPSGSGVGWTTSYFGDPRTYGLDVTYEF